MNYFIFPWDNAHNKTEFKTYEEALSYALEYEWREGCIIFDKDHNTVKHCY